MTKRFSPKAGDYTERLAVIQAKQAKLRRELSALEVEERAMKAYLMPFYDTGKTEVSGLSHDLTVNYSVNDRQILDQEKAKLIIVNSGKKVPFVKVSVTTFNVKVAK